MIVNQKNWNIDPYQSVGPLAFGMTQDEVASQLGAPRFKDYDRLLRNTTWYWEDNGVQAVFAGREGGLVMVSLYSNIDGVSILGEPLDWNASDRMFERLRNADNRARSMAGVSVFFRFGVSVAGFGSPSNGEKSITAFAEGQWDEHDPDLKPLQAYTFT